MLQILFFLPQAVIILKWSKMRQHRCHIDTVPIPDLCSALVCPVATRKVMLNSCFHVSYANNVVPLTESCAR